MSPIYALNILCRNLSLNPSEKSKKKLLKSRLFCDTVKSVEYKSKNYIGKHGDWGILEDSIRLEIEKELELKSRSKPKPKPKPKKGTSSNVTSRKQKVQKRKPRKKTDK